MASLHGQLRQLRGETLTTADAPANHAAKRKQRQAWILLIAAFCAFVLLAVFAPYAVRRYYLNATTPQEASLEVIAGTVRVSPPGDAVDVAANNGDAVLEGYTVKTDGTSRALLTLFDGSTIYVFENSQVQMGAMRASRFAKRVTLVRVVERQGRVRIGVAPPAAQESAFTVETPQASVNLRDGSYAVEVTERSTAVSVRAGEGAVTAQKSTVAVKRGQRSTVAVGQPPSSPGPAALDLVLNGDFRQKDVGWTIKTDVETGRRDDIYGQTLVQADGETPTVRFVRRGSKNSHGENTIRQEINRDVSDFVSLKLSLDFLLTYQSLSGGGYLGSEYPLMVRVTYRDVSGQQATWAHGFYYHNDANYPTTYGDQVPGSVWIPFEKDLFALEGHPRPFRLLSIEVSASGWDYESLLKSVAIFAE